MGAVHDIGNTFDIMDFEASLPLASCQAFSQVIFIDAVILLHDNRNCHCGNGCIDSLMRTDKRNVKQTLFQFLRHVFSLDDNNLSVFPFASGINFKVSSVEVDSGALFVSFFLEFLQGNMLRSGNYRDSRLLMGDFFQGISQILHVIHCHIRND